jgi:hypothetical protein
VNKPEKLWVGIFDATGALIVYDPRFQRENDDHIYVYSMSRNLVRRMSRVEVRNQIRSAAGTEGDEAIAKYRLWLQEGGTYDSAYVTGDIAANRAIDSHRKKIEAAGMPYLGVRSAYDKKHRTSHCWSCKKPLDSTVALECIACTWMLCKCGACGCNYHADLADRLGF